MAEGGQNYWPLTPCLDRYEAFFSEVETTRMTKSFKAVLLEALLEHDGFRQPPTRQELAAWSLEVFRRRPGFVGDIKADLQDLERLDERQWIGYWNRNPVNAWVGGNRKGASGSLFEVVDGHFRPTFSVDDGLLETFNAMLQELVDYRFAVYEPRLAASDDRSMASVVSLPAGTGTELPYFPDLRIACGHFRDGRHDVDETRVLGVGHGRLDPALPFIARAVGNSMNGGQRPVRDGDYLLLERIDPGHAGSISGDILAIERQSASGDDQYVLRKVVKDGEGRYRLVASNPDYPDFDADEGMRPLARLRAVLDPLELALGREF